MLRVWVLIRLEATQRPSMHVNMRRLRSELKKEERGVAGFRLDSNDLGFTYMLGRQLVSSGVKRTLLSQTPSTGLRHPSANHCHNLLRHRLPKIVSQRTPFRWCTYGSKFVTDSSNYIRRFFSNRARCLCQQN